ncbi:MAG: hypothetical protein Q4G16_01390 [Cruoricaptor ignavus]|nr:hypothetical protein [Cruoricaptor ignavus]
MKTNAISLLISITEFYKYDSANRLERIVDINGNILKEYKYHYRQ